MKVVTISYEIAAKRWVGPSGSPGALPTELDSEKTLVLVLGPSHLIETPQPVAEIVRAFPRSHVIGCSTTESVVNDRNVITLTAIHFDSTTIALAQAQHSEAFTAGQMLGKKLTKPSLRAILVFADGMEVGGAELVRGLNSTLDQSIVVFGGLAGDPTHDAKAWVLAGPNMKRAMAVAVGLYGDHVAIAHAIKSGWSKVGGELVVTKSDGRVIYELDGRPALTVYEECAAAAPTHGTLSDHHKALALPVAVRASTRHDKSLVRSVLGVDAAKNSITLSSDIPQGYLLQPLRASPQTLLEATRDASRSLEESQAPLGTDALVLMISHPARGIILGGHAREELQSAEGALPKGPTPHLTRLVGAGEIAPSRNGHCDLHNQSFAIAMIMESDSPVARKGARGLAAGAARAQGARAAGPAAHLRSRHQTVDDLFSAIEMEGGKVGERRPQIRSITSPPPSVAPSAPVHRQQPPPLAPNTNGSGSPATKVADLSVKSLSYAHDKWLNPIPKEIDGPHTLVLAFGEMDTKNVALDLASAFPKSHRIGCSAPLMRRVGSVPKVTANTMTFRHTKLGTAFVELSMGAAPAAQELLHKLVRPDLRAILLLVDGSSIDADAFLRTWNASVPKHVKVVGGVVAPGSHGWLLCDSVIKTHIATAVGFYGNHIVLSTSVRTGFDPVGPERQVTRSVGNIVYELDGRPALKVYTEYLARSTLAAGLQPNVPLPIPIAVKGPRGLSPRMPVSLDKTNLSISFASEIPTGSTVRLMRGMHEKLLSETSAAARAIASEVTEGERLLLAVSSSGRLLSLGDRAEEEVELILESMPEDHHTHITGFYSRAEITPADEGGSELSNESIAITSISESDVELSQQTTTWAVPEHLMTPPAPSIKHPAETPSPAQVATMPLRMPNPTSAAAPPPSAPPATTSPPISGGSSGYPKNRHGSLRPALSGASGGLTSGAKIARRVVNDVMVVSFAGRLTESFKGDVHGRELSGTVIFDLANVERITSFGVREWLTMLSVAGDRISKLYFAGCSEAIVNQLSMIRKFNGGAQVISFYAPYLCDSCGEQFERLFDCEYDANAIRANDPPDAVCGQCSGRARFDDDPETYFSFTTNHVGQPVPEKIRAVLGEIEPADAQGNAADAIEKTVEANLTRLKVKAKLGQNLRWQRILDGIDGTLVIDLGGAVVAEPTGVVNFENAMASIGAEVDSVRLERCPQSVVERFAETGLPRRLTITSVTLSAHCPSCNIQRHALLVVDDHMHALSASRDPALYCKRCNGLLSLADVQHIMQFLGRSRRRPSMQPRSAPPPIIEHTPVAPSQAPALSASPKAPTPVLSVPAPAPQPEGRGLITSFVILLVAVAVSVGLFTYARTRTNVTAPPAAPSPTVAAATSAPPLTPTPAWAERSFVEEGGMIYLVGWADHAPSAEQALSRARLDAVNHLVQHLYDDLVASSAGDYLTSLPKIDLSGLRSAQVAEKYLRQTATIQQPERRETVLRPRDGSSVEAFARYRLSAAAYKQAKALYSATTNFQGVVVARAFPLLDADREDPELVVTAISKRYPGKLGELLHLGDFVIHVNGKPILALDALSKVVEDWNAAPTNTTFEIGVRSNGVSETIKIKKPNTPVYYRQPPRPPPAPAPTPKPSAAETGSLPPTR